MLMKVDPTSSRYLAPIVPVFLIIDCCTWVEAFTVAFDASKEILPLLNMSVETNVAGLPFAPVARPDKLPKTFIYAPDVLKQVIAPFGLNKVELPMVRFEFRNVAPAPSSKVGEVLITTNELLFKVKSVLTQTKAPCTVNVLLPEKRTTEPCKYTLDGIVKLWLRIISIPSC